MYPTVYEPIFIIDAPIPIMLAKYEISEHIPKYNWHSDIEFYYTIEGHGEIYCEDKYIPVKKNEFCAINSNQTHSAKGFSDESFQFYNLKISDEFLQQNGISAKNVEIDTVFSDPIATKKLEDLYKIRSQSPDGDFYAFDVSVATLDFIQYVFKHHARYIKNPSEHYSDLSKSHFSTSDIDIINTIDYIRSNLTKKITLDTISEQVGLSKYHISKKFKKCTGYTIIEYINFLRCNQACQYMRTGEYTVKEAFNLSSFDNYSYFSTLFKKFIGVSPAEYLEHCKQKNYASKLNYK